MLQLELANPPLMGLEAALLCTNAGKRNRREGGEAGTRKALHTEHVSTIIETTRALRIAHPERKTGTSHAAFSNSPIAATNTPRGAWVALVAKGIALRIPFICLVLHYTAFY